MWMRSPAPLTVSAPAPYHVLLGLVAADDFKGVEEYWGDFGSRLSDEESLKVARACLTRSKQLDPAVTEPELIEVSSASAEDRAQAERATFMAWRIAAYIERFGMTPEIRDKGRQLAAQARTSTAVDHPGLD
jgi:hypothetical protein